MIKAGRIFFSNLNKRIDNRENIVIETTLSGSYINKIASKSRNLGYRLKLIYIFVDNANLCVERVRSRVLKGGHDVPENDIRRRFQRSLHNFWENFTNSSDFWILLYNGEENFQQVAIGTQLDFSIENQVLFNKFNSIKN